VIRAHAISARALVRRDRSRHSAVARAFVSLRRLVTCVHPLHANRAIVELAIASSIVFGAFRRVVPTSASSFIASRDMRAVGRGRLDSIRFDSFANSSAREFRAIPRARALRRPRSAAVDRSRDALDRVARSRGARRAVCGRRRATRDADDRSTPSRASTVNP